METCDTNIAEEIKKYAVETGRIYTNIAPIKHLHKNIDNYLMDSKVPVTKDWYDIIKSIFTLKKELDPSLYTKVLKVQNPPREIKNYQNRNGFEIVKICPLKSEDESSQDQNFTKHHKIWVIAMLSKTKSNFSDLTPADFIYVAGQYSEDEFKKGNLTKSSKENDPLNIYIFADVKNPKTGEKIHISLSQITNIIKWSVSGCAGGAFNFSTMKLSSAETGEDLSYFSINHPLFYPEEIIKRLQSEENPSKVEIELERYRYHNIRINKNLMDDEEDEEDEDKNCNNEESNEKVIKFTKEETQKINSIEDKWERDDYRHSLVEKYGAMNALKAAEKNGIYSIRDEGRAPEYIPLRSAAPIIIIKHLLEQYPEDTKEFLLNTIPNLRSMNGLILPEKFNDVTYKEIADDLRVERDYKLRKAEKKIYNSRRK